MSRVSVYPALLAAMHHLQEHAARYYPQCACGTVDVRRLRVAERRFALLGEFELRCGAWCQRVVAKLNRSDSADADSLPVSANHARFIGSPDRPGAEAAALTAYSQQVASQSNSQLFAVRVLDSIHHDQVLLMERACCAPLTKFLSFPLRVGRAHCSSQLLRLMEHAGDALSTVHQMPPGKMRQHRGTTRDDFLAWIDVMEEFFRDDCIGHRAYRQLAPRLRNAALQLLDETLPCGPQHNDFAPRNVLVDERGRVAVIDMLEEWYGCVWEDVAHFLVSLEANKAQALSGDWFFPRALLANMRSAFLNGYAPKGRIDDRVVRLFEAQIALTKWAASLQQQQERRGLPKLLRRWPQAMGARCYARYAERCIAKAETALRRGTPSTFIPVVAGGVS